jgi:predicted metal-dependent hydrolase
MNTITVDSPAVSIITDLEPYSIIRKKVKNVRIKVLNDGKVECVFPYSYSNQQAHELLYSYSDWIAKQRAKLQTLPRLEYNENQLLFKGIAYTVLLDKTLEGRVILDETNRTISSGYDLLKPVYHEQWYSWMAKGIVAYKAEQIAGQHNFRYTKIRIGNPKTRWGSCSSSGTISISWRLMKAPDWVLEYVIAHELVHTVYMNHGKEFWSLLNQVFPRTNEAEVWLDTYGKFL